MTITFTVLFAFGHYGRFASGTCLFYFFGWHPFWSFLLSKARHAQLQLADKDGRHTYGKNEYVEVQSNTVLCFLAKVIQQECCLDKLPCQLMLIRTTMELYISVVVRISFSVFLSLGIPNWGKVLWIMLGIVRTFRTNMTSLTSKTIHIKISNRCLHVFSHIDTIAVRVSDRKLHFIIRSECWFVRMNDDIYTHKFPPKTVKK